MIGKGQLRYIFFVLFLFFSAIPSFSMGGQEEDRLKIAEKLIEEQKYNQAIELIQKEIEDNPDRFDEGEALMQKIREIRSDYNVLYQELIDVLYVEKDVKKALEIIAEMEKMDADPNPATKELIRKAKETARFVYNQEEFLRIMNQAASYISDKRYMDAISLYRTGFELYREEFFASDYGDIIKNGMKVALDNLNVFLDDIEGKYTLLNQAYNDFFTKLEQEKKGEYKVVAEDYLEFSSVLADFISKVAAVKNIGNYIYATNINVINSFNLDREDFFLGFMQRYVTGRVNTDIKDGITGALDQYINSYMFTIISTLDELMDSYFSVASGKVLDSAVSAISDVNRLSSLVLSLQKDWGGLYVVRENKLEKGLSDNVVNIWPYILKAKAVKNSIAILSSLYSLDKIDITESSDRDKLESYLSLIEDQFLKVYSLLSQLKDEESKLLASYGNVLSRMAQSVYEIIKPIFIKKLNLLTKSAIGLNEKISSLDVAVSETEQKKISDTITESENLIRGKEEVILVGDKEETILAKYPDKAIENIEVIKQRKKELIIDIENLKKFFVSQREEFINSKIISDNINKLDSILDYLIKLDNNIINLEKQASAAVFNADRYRNEAERKLEEAERAINLKNYEDARNLLEDAGDLFSTSLSYKEDKALRESMDKRLLALSDAIVKAENQKVIVEVRSLIEKGRELYLRGNFDEAERTLLTARARWAVTQPEENPEVEYWLKFVKAALSIQRGRTVLDTDPLYTEITQLLNLARANYTQAKTLIKQGKQEEGGKLLDKATENLLRVRMAFPLNQDASLLLLRIEQLKNPDSFDSLFKEKINEAVAQLDESPQEAYATLKDLREIKPDFPGLANAIYQAEIKLGIRIPPPDPAKISRAKELYKNALAIYNRNDRANFPIALEQLNQAVLLDPDNREAISLKDRIQLAMGGQTSVVLPSYALKLYKDAEQKFTEGSFYEALAIVRKLLEDERAKNYPPLLELKKRIESRI
ncbi:hypothetical protein WKV44_04900 [Spirochaetia bacterium 38H-sp]|uniref:Tetratricopeptide repeat-containing protein n=1 Tax=Rarispira pelagica TaxID=3141764 RepID=A0ABU9UD54_9SPIR